ncbi:MAG: extracellular solute-binding protein [Clostridia bacterium]|nr:extracellular solute-binding protein [Clostridia bacterium]MBQ9995481.1 extracellular solute-binding protein [Clostridia bacterium]
MKKQNRLAALLLALLLALPLASCASNDTTNPDEAQNGTTSEAGTAEEAVPEETEEERIKPNIPATADFGGDEIYFLHWYHPSWASTVRTNRDIYAESLTGEAINDVVYNRNMKIETDYNVKIAFENLDLGQIDGAVSKAVASGDDTYDVVYPRLYEAASMYQKDYFLNLFEVPNLDLTQPWWDGNCVESLSMNNRLLAVAGSLNINDKDATAALAFNKGYAESLGLPNIYEIVYEGEWTYDQLISMAEGAAVDTDGNGIMEDTDMWGLLGGNDVMSCFWFGSGELMVTKDENDIFQFTFGSERSITAAERVVSLMNQSWFLNHHKIANTDDAYYTQLFETGHGLFFWMRLDEVTNMRAGDTDFGIIPTPKYEASQDNYYSMVSQHTTGLMSIPLVLTGEKLSNLGIILEAMAAESHYELIPTYIEESLKTKYSRDAESAGMLDIIINNRVFDPMIIYNFGGFADTFQGWGGSNNTQIASTLAKSQKPVQKILDRFIEASLED